MATDERTDTSTTKSERATRTQDVTELMDSERRDESTAHLTLPSLPQDKGVKADGTVVDKARVDAAQAERKAALAPVETFVQPEAPKASTATDERKLEVHTDEKSQTQEATTVVPASAVKAAQENAARGTEAALSSQSGSVKTPAQKAAGSDSVKVG